MREIKVTSERILRFEAKYGKEASTELIGFINDTRDDLGYNEGNDAQGIADLINEGTQKIVEEKILLENDKEEIKTQPFERVRIGYNERGCIDKLYRLRNSIEELNTYKAPFENLGLVWNINTLMDFLVNGAIESENRVLNMINQEVERCVFPGRKESLERELNNTIHHSFRQLKADIKRAKPDCDAKCLEMVGPSVCLSSEGQKVIEDSFIIYANTPEELEIWNEASELVERLKNMDARLKPFGIYAIAQWDFNSPALIRVSDSTPAANAFMIEDCNDSSIRKGKG